MKKYFFFFTLFLLPMMIKAKNIEIDGIYYNIVSKTKEAEVIKNPNNYTGDIVIPSEFKYEGETYTVTSIGSSSFTESKVTSITMPNSIKRIEGAFIDCYYLTSITMSNNLQTIGDMAFYNCERLKSIFIPKTVTSIGKLAFFDCKSLTAVHIEDIVSWCKIDFAQDVSNPLVYAHHLYLNDEEVTNLVVPKEVKSICKNSFWGCESIISVVISDGVSSVGATSFYGCINIEELTISNSVLSIGEAAFYGCKKIKSLNIPKSVSFIGAESFRGCSNLISIIVDNENTKYDSRYKCNALIETSTNTLLIGCSNTVIPNGVLKIQNGAFQDCSGLTSMTIPNSVTYIGAGVFMGCRSITSMVLGSGVSFIHNAAFADCEELRDLYCYATTLPTTQNELFRNSYISYATLHVPAVAINIYKDTQPWNEFGQIVALTDSDPQPTSTNPTSNHETGTCGVNAKWTYETDTKILTISGSGEMSDGQPWESYKDLVEKVVIEDGITSIGTSAFNKFSNLASVIIPSGVTKIGEDAFNGCDKLQSVDIPNSVTFLGTCAFKGCANLSKVTMSQSITTINDGLFGHCQKLAEISIPEGVTNIGNGSFEECSFSSFIIPSSVAKLGVGVFAGCSKLEELTCLPKDVPTADNRVFDNLKIDNITLKVPAASARKYKESEPWKNFKEIVKIGKAEYSLTYMVDGEVYKTYQIEEGATITPEPAPTKEGYTFSGWSEIPDAMPDNDLTITGSFTINKYKLTYKVDGEVYKEFELEYGASITPEPAPTKEGYTFSGWSEIPSTMPAKDVTVTGNFTKGTYKLVYKVDGEVYKTISYNYGDAITPEPAPTKEGYTFSGWSEIPSTMPAKDVTITGSFTINKYKLTYIVDGEIYKEYDIEYGATITPEPAPTKEGYEFSGWSDIPSTMPANNVEITGSFKQIDYKVEGATYEISGEGTVSIKGGDQKGNVEISGTVVINGQAYKVTAIAENAFVGNTQITSVTIPEGITTIGSNAFSGCVNMLVINIGKSVSSIGNKAFANVGTSSTAKTRGENSFIVNCYAESVPQTAADAFENSPIATGTLLVNDNIVDAYKTTSPWSQFGKIQGFQEAAGIGSIIIDNPNAHIYDMQGNRIDNLQKGVNIIRLEDGKTKKVIVK